VIDCFASLRDIFESICTHDNARYLGDGPRVDARPRADTDMTHRKIAKFLKTLNSALSAVIESNRRAEGDF
jgi:hypothetical protein